MLKFQLPVGDELAFARLSYGEKLRLMQEQLDIYMLEKDITAKKIHLDPETRFVTLEDEVEGK